MIGEAGIGKTSLIDAFQRANEGRRRHAVGRGQSVEGFGGKEPYYPLFEAVGQLARGPSRALVVDTLATNAPTWLIQFPFLVRAEQKATLQREILGATRERMVREFCEALEVDHRDGSACARSRGSPLGRSRDAGHHLGDRPSP